MQSTGSDDDRISPLRKFTLGCMVEIRPEMATECSQGYRHLAGRIGRVVLVNETKLLVGVVLEHSGPDPDLWWLHSFELVILEP